MRRETQHYSRAGRFITQRKRWPMMWRVCLMLLWLSNCAPAGPVSEACLLFSPLYLTGDDVLSTTTARAMLQHNEIWQAVCGDEE